ncbi:MAG: MATE family efflux transporter [Lachnospiraceae bacterium]
MKDLTKGYPAKVILMFAFPLMCGYIFQQLYNMADSKIVSTFVGTAAFAAVGATSVVSNTLIGFINGLTQGFAILVANSFGAKDYRRMRQYVAGTVILTVCVTVILTAAGMGFIEPVLKVLNTPEEIMGDALSYVRIIIAGIAWTALYNMSANILRAVGDSKTPLYCLLLAVAVNIGLDLLFVGGFRWQIAGAAYATVISQALSGLLCGGYILKKFRDLIPESGEWELETGQYRELITTGLSMGLMGCIVNIGTIVLQSAINGLGTKIVAAHTASRRVFDILTVTIFTIGLAMTTFVSQNMGAGQTGRIKQGVRHALVIVSVITTILIVICFAFGKGVLIWITNSTDPEIIDAAVMYTKVSILFFYVLGPLFVLRCSLQGMGRKIIPVCSSILEMVVKVLSAAFLVPALGYFGVALTEPISWIVMTILLAAAYLSKPPEKLTVTS